MRLDKYLEQAQVGSRKAVKRLLVSKQVRVGGAIVMDSATDVDPLLAEIAIGNKKINGPSHVYYMLHKPSGVVSAVKDHAHQTVIDLLTKEDCREGIFPVGRLDRDTEGLLLLTNNGKLGYHLLQPKSNVKKEYEAVVNERVTEHEIALFKEGIIFIGGYRCLPAILEIVELLAEGTRVRVTITEGKFHQVKKMFLAVGMKVTYLKRLKMGSLVLDETLAVGQYRKLSILELKKLQTVIQNKEADV